MTKEMRMTVRKILLAACAAALTTSPAWALPGRVPSNDGTGHAPSTVPAGSPTDPGSSQDAPGSRGQGGSSGQHHGRGRSHRCVAHGVAYVAAGTLVSQTLVLDGSGGPTPSVAAAADAGRGRSARPTYSGDVTIAVTRTNAHARPDKGTTKTYTLDHARVLFGLADQNGDGSVGLDDLAAGDRVKVIGKVTVLRRGCDQTGFTPAITIGKLIVHAPAKQQPTG
jgi:hypothetical protein